MIKDTKLIALLSVGALLFLIYSSMYIVREGEQAVVFQFGKPVGAAVTDAGLKFKIPFIQNVKKFEKRILEWDGDPTEIPLEGKYILVDTFARWKISEPQLFYKSVMDVSGAQSRLDDIINGVVRDEVSDSKLEYVVANTIFNSSYDNDERKEGELFKGNTFSRDNCILNPDQESEYIINGEWTFNPTGKFYFCDVGKDRGRQAIVDAIIEKVQAKFNSEKMGIEVVDIQIKRINYTDAVRNSVFKKIESEQNIKAALLKSEGQLEARKIIGAMEKKEKDITSSGYKESEIIKGRGDSVAAAIYRLAYSKNPQFYTFYEALNSIEKIIGDDDQVVLTTKSDIFKLLKNIDQ